MTSDDLKEARVFAQGTEVAVAILPYLMPLLPAVDEALPIVRMGRLLGILADEVERLQSQLGPPPKSDREAFVKQNAIPVVADLERKVERQRLELKKLNRRRHTHVAERRTLVERIDFLQRFSANQTRLLDAQFAEWKQAEAEATEAKKRLEVSNHYGCERELALQAKCDQLQQQVDHLLAVIRDVHAQHADDLCWMPADVNQIFQAAGLPPQDLRVGDTEAMLANCRRYVACLQAGGPWQSYAALEQERDALKKLVSHCLVYSGSMDCGFWHMTPEQQALYKRLRTECRL